MSQFLHDNDNNNADAKAIAIPWVFSENSRANKICLRNTNTPECKSFGQCKVLWRTNKWTDGQRNRQKNYIPPQSIDAGA